MSRENVEAFERGNEAINRRDIEALLDELDPDVEWHDVFNVMLGGQATTYRGHDGVRELFGDLFGAFAEAVSEYPDVRDLGGRLAAIGRLRVRGNESGAETESPVATVVEYRNAKAIRVRTYLDPSEALHAAGLDK